MPNTFRLFVALQVGFVASAAAANRPNLVLVTIDTLRADRLGCYGYPARGEGGSATPHLDRLARRGLLFSDASAQVPLTLPSHASILTGLDPLSHGVRNNGGAGLPASRTTLAEILHEAGYSTGAFVGAFPLDHSFGLNQGFDVYDDRTETADKSRFLFAERAGDNVMESALPWLRSRPGPFFLWLHVYDPHAPHQAPPGFTQADSYDGEIAFVDTLVGRLVEDLRAKPQPTTLIITADHGEAFGEHGEIGHGVFVYQATMHIPLLVVRLDGSVGKVASDSDAGARGTVRDEAVETLDILPTVLDAVGLPERPELPGRSLVARRLPSPPRSFLLESMAPLLDYGWHELAALRTGPWKHIRAPRPELYNLFADPGERRNLRAVQSPDSRDLSDRVAQLETELDGILAARSPTEPTNDVEAVEPDPETAAALASLGYASAGSTGQVPATDRPDPKDKIDTLRELGLAAQQPTDQAIATLRGLLEREPTNKLARQRLGWLLYFSKQLAPAGDQFKLVLEESVSDQRVQSGAVPTEVVLALADCEARTGRPESAIRTMQRFVQDVDRPAFLLLNLGYHLRRAGREAEAVAAWHRGLELEPGLEELKRALGQ